MKKSILVGMIICICASFSWGQDLNALGNDISTLFESIGNDSMPNLMQNAVAGEGIGMASMGEKRFFMSTSLGTVMTNGILLAVDEANTDFELLNAYNLFNDMFSENSALYERSKTFFLYPNARLAIGIKAFLGIEMIGTFSIFPGFVTGFVSGLLPDGSDEIAANLEFNRMNAGILLRKALIEDSGGLPAVSIGAGYSFGNFHTAIGIPALPEQDFSGLTLDVGGTLNIDTSVHAAGIEVAVSKRLAFFVPFLNVGAWYQWAKYDAEIDNLVLRLLDITETPVATEDDLLEQPGSSLSLNDLSILIQGGFELGGKGFAIIPNGSFNLSTGSYGAGISTRLMF